MGECGRFNKIQEFRNWFSSLKHPQWDNNAIFNHTCIAKITQNEITRLIDSFTVVICVLASQCSILRHSARFRFNCYTDLREATIINEFRVTLLQKIMIPTMYCIWDKLSQLCVVAKSHAIYLRSWIFDVETKTRKEKYLELWLSLHKFLMSHESIQVFFVTCNADRWLDNDSLSLKCTFVACEKAFGRLCLNHIASWMFLALETFFFSALPRWQ